jgi:hypothetical protein
MPIELSVPGTAHSSCWSATPFPEASTDPCGATPPAAWNGNHDPSARASRAEALSSKKNLPESISATRLGMCEQLAGGSPKCRRAQNPRNDRVSALPRQPRAAVRGLGA